LSGIELGRARTISIGCNECENEIKLGKLTFQMGISRWKEKARNRDQWRRIIEEAKAHPGL
jgi:hypothetical protein